MDDLTLFHVSARSFENNAPIGPFPANDFVGRVSAADENARRMEALFNERKPPGIVSRQHAVFAFDSLARCAAWWEAESRSGRFPEVYAQRPNYYQVRLTGVHRAPYFLTSYALAFVAQGAPAEAIAIVDEYWKPVMPWLCWEFLGESASVVHQLPSPQEKPFIVPDRDVSKDRKAALTRWPLPQTPGLPPGRHE